MKHLTSFLKYSVIILVTGYLLYYSYMSIDVSNLAAGQTRWQFILQTWNKSNKFYLALSAIIAVLSHVTRAYTWQILLKPLGYKFSLKNSFLAVMNGYFVNLFIPRGGEISRPYALKKTDNVPAEVGIGTIVTERILDILLLLLCIGTVFVFQLTKFSSFFGEIMKTPEAQQQSKGLINSTTIGAALLVVVLVMAVSLYIYKIKKRFFLRITIKGKILLFGLKDGLLSVFKLEKRFLYIGLLLSIWIMYFFMQYTMFMAFDDTKGLSLFDCLTIFTVSSIAMAMPMPGGTGSYHFIVPKALVLLCGIQSNAGATAFATIFHAYHTLIIIIIGSIGIFVTNQEIKRKKLLAKA